MISIIVPVYNVEKYLERCIESILSQTYKNFELIIINDGSSDKSIDICEKYKAIDSRIIFINQSNKGVSAARNVGLDIAKGDYVAFVDSDDYIENDMYEILINSIEGNNADISVCGFYELRPNNKRNELFIKKESFIMKSEDCINKFFEENYIKDLMYAPWNKLFKRKVIGDIRFNEKLSMGEDILFIFECLGNCNSIFFNNKSKYNYIYRENSAMRAEFSEKRFDYIKAFDYMEKICLERYPNLIKSVKKQCFYHKLNCCRKIILNSNHNEIYDIEFKKMLLYIEENKKIVFRKMNYKRKIDYILVRYLRSSNIFINKFLKLCCLIRKRLL